MRGARVGDSAAACLVCSELGVSHDDLNDSDSDISEEREAVEGCGATTCSFGPNGTYNIAHVNLRAGA